jgi:hypothetical protein
LNAATSFGSQITATTRLVGVDQREPEAGLGLLATIEQGEPHVALAPACRPGYLGLNEMPGSNAIPVSCKPLQPR